MMRYFVGFMITIGLIILLIVLLFHGGGKTKVPVTHKTLNSYAATNAEARLTIDGPVNSEQKHQQVRISVDRDQVTFEQLQGYDGEVVVVQSYGNTENAYAAFLHALTHAGFTIGNTNPDLKDERGYCPLGNRYIFELEQDSKDIERYWSTSCGKPKTYGGNTLLTLNLFKAQVPNYASLTQSLAL